MTPTPYYSDPFITLYHGDALEMVDAWVGGDVLCTDPPYGIGYASGWNKGYVSNRVKGRNMGVIAGDGDTEVRDAVLTAWQTTPGRPALVFGRWDVPRPPGVRNRLIWSKGDDPGMGDLKMPWGKSDEEIYVIGNGWTGKRTSNIITCGKPPVANRDAHPTPKPVQLMERLIEKCPPGVIVDPFAGSGSTLVAAKKLGRRVIGVEMVEAYCEIIANRAGQEALSFDLIV